MTHLSRPRLSLPRLWLTASLAALSLMVFVTFRVRRTAAQETPVEKPAVQKPESETNANSAAPTSPQALSLDLVENEILHDANGNVVVPLEKSLAEIQKVIRDCDHVSVALGRRNLVLSILANTDRMRLAEAIFEATKDNDGVHLISGDSPTGKYLMIRTPQKDLKQPEVRVGGKIAQAVIAALMGGIIPPSQAASDGVFVDEPPVAVGLRFQKSPSTKNGNHITVAVPTQGVHERTVSLKAELQQAERESEQAARLARGQTTQEAKDVAVARLRETVTKEFAARQRLQTFEADLLRTRLRQIDDRLQERERLQDRIIQRRVEDLTNSNLEWAASEPLENDPLGGVPVDPLIVRPRYEAESDTIQERTPSGKPTLTPRSNNAQVEVTDGLLYFESTWSGPCLQQGKVIDQLQRQGVPIRRIDVDKERSLVEQCQVTSVPTFIRVFQGRENDRIVGRFSEERIRELLTTPLRLTAPLAPPNLDTFITVPNRPGTASPSHP